MAFLKSGFISASVCFLLGLAGPTRARDLNEHEQIFTSIYDQAVWGKNDQGVGFSGGGSLLCNTRAYINLLVNFMKEYGIGSVVDAGCGDWEFARFINWDGIEYRGYDIVGFVIEKNIQLYASQNIHFFHANFLETDLPSADLLLCKDVLQHLRNRDILEFLSQLKKFKYCLITNDVDPVTFSSANNDINIGSHHPLDLSRPPFNVQGTKLLNYSTGTEVKQIFFLDNTTVQAR
ncbi:MAG: class I SAM-dependent methyltransferase [Candidatus Dependentiae bacterium]|nr:class I SAM-dependent methyltransferase [Candidatus Dependentiae bacterium]